MPEAEFVDFINRHHQHQHQIKCSEITNECLKDIKSLEKDEIVYCNLPIEVAVAVATQLALVAVADRDDLPGVGIKPLLLDTMAARTRALAYAAAAYQMAIEQDPEAARMWKEASPAGYELRKYLVTFMSFAYRTDKAVTLQK